MPAVDRYRGGWVEMPPTSPHRRFPLLPHRPTRRQRRPDSGKTPLNKRVNAIADRA
jgi:hypothetical protein